MTPYKAFRHSFMFRVGDKDVPKNFGMIFADPLDPTVLWFGRGILKSQPSLQEYLEDVKDAAMGKLQLYLPRLQGDELNGDPIVADMTMRTAAIVSWKKAEFLPPVCQGHRDEVALEWLKLSGCTVVQTSQEEVLPFP